jgi:uncharacterized protein with HEPN domain
MACDDSPNSGGESAAISSVSSERSRGGRATTPRGAAIAALRAGGRALELIAHDDEAGYLANGERQLAVERLLIRFGEALKSIPNDTLRAIDQEIAWGGPKGFRDIASHWYEDSLDHRLIWHALVSDLPQMVASLQRWIDASGTSTCDPVAT